MFMKNLVNLLLIKFVKLNLVPVKIKCKLKPLISVVMKLGGSVNSKTYIHVNTVHLNVSFSALWIFFWEKLKEKYYG